MSITLSNKKMCTCTGRIASNGNDLINFDYYCLTCGQYYTIDEYNNLPDYK